MYIYIYYIYIFKKQTHIKYLFKKYFFKKKQKKHIEDPHVFRLKKSSRLNHVVISQAPRLVGSLDVAKDTMELLPLAMQSSALERGPREVWSVRYGGPGNF